MASRVLGEEELGAAVPKLPSSSPSFKTWILGVTRDLAMGTMSVPASLGVRIAAGHHLEAK